MLHAPGDTHLQYPGEEAISTKKETKIVLLENKQTKKTIKRKDENTDHVSVAHRHKTRTQ